MRLRLVRLRATALVRYEELYIHSASRAMTAINKKSHVLVGYRKGNKIINGLHLEGDCVVCSPTLPGQFISTAL